MLLAWISPLRERCDAGRLNETLESSEREKWCPEEATTLHKHWPVGHINRRFQGELVINSVTFYVTFAKQAIRIRLTSKGGLHYTPGAVFGL